MFLEKLEVFGFKSFGEKLEVRFSPGITGVIGPNGCGKTNISDALRWVLGEQSMKRLRGDVAGDVIFNGSATRKPLGMADCTLTLSNASRWLPTEYETVQVGRRIYRSGESQYLLNKTDVRLKDVRNLFFDTGMGSNAYSVIEREMVDNILADGSHQRRFLFEEAAGITKYKARKRETMSKLEATEADLLRVNDLVSEIERELRSLDYQAGKTRRWKRMHDEARAMDLRLTARAQVERVARLAELEEVLKASRDRMETDVAGLGGAEADLETLRLRVLETERNSLAAQARLAELREELAGLHNRISVGQERARGLLAQLQQGEADQARLATQMGQLETEKARLSGEEAQLAAALEERQQRLETEEVALREAESALAEKRNGLQAQRQLSFDLVKAAVQRRAETEQTRAYLVRCEEHLAAVGAQEAALRAQLEEVAGRMETGRAALEQESARLAGLKDREAGLEERVRALSHSWNSIQAEEQASRERMATLESRLLTLQELKTNFEGFEGGVKVLFEGGQAPGSRGVVADLLEVPRPWMDALEVFLGPVLQAVVVENDEAAHQGRERLVAGQSGRATFVPLSRLGAHPPVALPQDLASHPGVVGHAHGVVRARPGFEALSEMLLGHVVLVEHEGVARELSSRFQGSSWGFLTPQGEFWGPQRLHLGAGSMGTKILHRDAEIADLLVEFEAVSREIQSICARREEIELSRSGCQAELAEVKAQRIQSEGAALEAERQCNRVITESRLAESERNSRRQELERLQREREALLIDLSSAEVEVEERSRRAEEARHGASELEGSLQSLEARREERQKAASEMRVEWTRVHTRRSEIGSRRSEVEALLEETRRALAERSVEAAARVQERTGLLEELAGAEARHTGLNTGTSEAEQTWRDVDAAHLSARSEEGLADARARELRKGVEATREVFHSRELELHDLRALLEQDLARLKVEYELEDFSILQEQGPPTEGDDFERLADLKARIKGLGPVNPMAMEEHGQHKERADFMTSQRDDLVQARAQLLEVIEKINLSARSLFLDTFAAAREKFKEVFQTVFEGGEADLELVGDDPLEAEIEIIARPRGKRPQSIQLLSSGERSLTAISLLFGIYLVKPSPFCILDEVDAPLDDANIDRYLNLLRVFSKNTQFVVITHNKRTMEVCDVLYGVTMPEPGNSKLVSVKFGRAGLEETPEEPSPEAPEAEPALS